MSDIIVAAVDLGAESGRVAAARFDGTRIDLDIVTRFANQPVERQGRLHWDIESLWSEISAGLATLGSTTPVASVGVDTWGLDYGLYDTAGELLEGPLHYRTPHRVTAFGRAVANFGARRIYNATGIQLMEINSLFGMLADQLERPELLRRADLMLMMPDVVHHRLSGSRVTELTAASTTSMFDLARGDWARGLLGDLGLPTHFLPEVVQPGTDVGPLTGDLVGVAGLAATRVILPAAHDTASAVLTIPNASSDMLFISSGTWSLVGVVLDEPIVTEQSRTATLTNEGGYDGTVRFLRNVMGLWVLQECRRQWQREGVDIDYESLVRLAEAERPLVSVVNVNAVEFLAPGDMPTRIRDFCRRTSQHVPETMGAVARVIIDSLALGYRNTLEDIESVTGVAITSIAVVGGGGQNALLQQATASATGLPVVCWAKEATALGNAAVQLRTLGELDSIEQIWEVIAASTQVRVFEPVSSDRWDAAALTLRDQEGAELRRRGLGDSEWHTKQHQKAGA